MFFELVVLLNTVKTYQRLHLQQQRLMKLNEGRAEHQKNISLYYNNIILFKIINTLIT